jgi:hypothetical protein
VEGGEKNKRKPRKLSRRLDREHCVWQQEKDDVMLSHKVYSKTLF